MTFQANCLLRVTFQANCLLKTLFTCNVKTYFFYLRDHITCTLLNLPRVGKLESEGYFFYYFNLAVLRIVLLLNKFQMLVFF